ncbi:MAG: polyphenol oxidase family protein [Candidatus Omnitrophica bacterium]|nr:polyphenol oxidase family protein [Candidatus Omnitrophota bacterium]
MANIRYEHFLGVKVVAFSSDGSLDFLKGDPAATGFKLTGQQRAFLERAGIKGRVIFPKQVHGDVIWEVGPKDADQAGVYEADAVVTTTPGLGVAVRTADCLPLMLFAPGRNVVAAVHAGWKSTRLDIAAKTMALLKKKYLVDPATVRAAIGPCIRTQSCAVGPEFREYFPQEVVEGQDGLHFDIAAANRRQLLSEGVRAENIFDCGCDTFTDRAWHSFRRDGEASGRLIHAIMMKG